MKIPVELTDEQRQRLDEKARCLNVPLEELASAAVRDFLSQGEADFERAAALVLEKNRDLYRRLA